MPSTDRLRTVRFVAATAALLACAVWLGGIVALGAIAAPVVFSVAPFPQSADAMTTVFRRFDLVAMTCAAVLVGAEGVRLVARVPFSAYDWARTAIAVIAATLAVVEGVWVSPRIAELHFAGALRGIGGAGMELSRLHDLAELGGKAQIALLVGVVFLEVSSLLGPPKAPRRGGLGRLTPL